MLFSSLRTFAICAAASLVAAQDASRTSDSASATTDYLGALTTGFGPASENPDCWKDQFIWAAPDVASCHSAVIMSNEACMSSAAGLTQRLLTCGCNYQKDAYSCIVKHCPTSTAQNEWIQSQIEGYEFSECSSAIGPLGEGVSRPTSAADPPSSGDASDDDDDPEDKGEKGLASGLTVAHGLGLPAMLMAIVGGLAIAL